MRELTELDLQQVAGGLNTSTKDFLPPSLDYVPSPTFPIPPQDPSPSA